jgi:hypothetical protein
MKNTVIVRIEKNDDGTIKAMQKVSAWEVLHELQEKDLAGFLADWGVVSVDEVQGLFDEDSKDEITLSEEKLAWVSYQTFKEIIANEPNSISI